VFGEKPLLLLVFLPQIPYSLAWDQSRALAVEGWGCRSFNAFFKSTNFPKIQKPTQNYGHQKDDEKQELY
jgi:hypothetical protein